MLKNYIKIAFKVMMRRKLFTGISLFGISFTLTILIVGFSFYDFLFNPHYPELKQDRMLYLNLIHVYETKNSNHYYGYPSYHFIEKYVKNLESAEIVSTYSAECTSVSTYRNNKKIKLDLRYTDANYWNILDIEFLEGRPFNTSEVTQASRVAVLSESAAKEYFEDIECIVGTFNGKKTVVTNDSSPKQYIKKTESVIGKYIEADKIRYKIIGVVKDVPAIRSNAYAKIWIPVTTSKIQLDTKNVQGSHAALLLAENKKDRDKIQKQFQNQLQKVDLSGSEPFKHIESYLDTKLTGFTRLLPSSEYQSNGLTMFFILLTIILVFFISLPAINLTNINVNRILERSSEIGVRKSFGSDRIHLVGQFLVENIIITLIGSVFAFVFSVIILQIIENSNFIPYGDFHINFRILLYGILISLLFGFISGVLPALRMSRLQIVEAFKGGIS